MMGEKGKVCVTGAAGFVASWLVKRLLDSGYEVVGTVRDPDDEKKVGHLRRLEGATQRLKLIKADLMEDGSFDAAIFGCQGVFHTASPLLPHSSNSDVDPKVAILQPAIQGTLNVLRSCNKNPSLRRVVLTSSSSTVRIRDDIDPQMPILDESSWSSEEICERLKIWYALSKILAEKAAWKFCEDNSIDLVSVIPSFVIGPSLAPSLSSTPSDVLGLLKGVREKFEWHGRMGYVHIDDVALSHILVYENENARGRFLCNSTVLDVDQLAAILSARYPALSIPKTLKKVERPHYELDVSKLKGLGMRFRSIEEMFDDCVESLTMQGLLSPTDRA